MKKKSKLLLVNILLIFVWHCASFVACVFLRGDVFDSGKEEYQPRKWEKNGKWYKEKLGINKWKDLLPQHVGKNGFSKRNLDMDNITVEYVDMFIYETCRGEWQHRLNALFAPVIFLFNLIFKSAWFGVLFAWIILACNLPFLIIQRYNRFRLFRLRKRLVIRSEKNKSRKKSD